MEGIPHKMHLHQESIYIVQRANQKHILLEILEKKLSHGKEN